MRGSLTPSIVPNGTDQTVYIVLCDFGPFGSSLLRDLTPRIGFTKSNMTAIGCAWSATARVRLFTRNGYDWTKRFLVTWQSLI
jgi:hypothetical protein